MITHDNTKDLNKKHYNHRQVSIYKNFNSGLSDLNQTPFYKNTHSLNIIQIFEVIKSGGNIHGIKDIRENIRYIQTHTKEEYQYVKLNLPSFTVSACFQDERKKNASKLYTQILCFDFDKLENSRVQEMIEMLKKWEFTLLVFRSPSGKGIKLFVCVDSTEKQHELVYRCFELFFKDTFDLDADMQCIDYSRLCFFSYDKSAYFNDTAAYVTTKQLLDKYKHEVKLENSRGEAVDFINYDTVNTENIKSIFYSFVGQLQANGVDWIDGKKNQFLLELPKLKKWCVTYNECLTELINFVDGRYCQKYTQNNLPNWLADNWKRYGNRFNILKPPSKDKLLIQDYLSEQADFIKTELLSKRILFIDAPTGAGKTTLIKQIAGELNLKTDIIMPTTSLVDQQKDIKGITGRKVLSSELVNADILACCYNRINSLQDRNSKLLVIDEAHSLVSDYSYKSKTVQDIQRNLNRYDYIMYLSGSMLPLDGYYSEDNLLSYDKENRFNYEYEIVKLDDGVADNEYFINALDLNKLNVFYKNDKAVLDKLYIYLTEKGYKVAYISRDKKDNVEYKGIIENSSLVGYDVLLTTCIIQAGVNIKICDRETVITYGKRSNIIDYIQFTARFRANKPVVKIIHSGKIGQIQVNSCEEFLERVELEKKLLEKARNNNHDKIIDFDFLEADRIIKGYDLVFEDTDGNYVVDTFRLLFENYCSLNANIGKNVRVLKHYLSLFNFSEISSQNVEIDEIETKKLNKAGRNYNKEKKAKRDKTINEILSGTYIFGVINDSIVKDIERKYGFLSKYFTDSHIKERKKLLTSKSAFEQYKSKVTFLLADTDITEGKQVGDQVLLDYQRLKSLESSIKIKETYSNKEIKEIILNCGFTTTSNDYINYSLGIIFKFNRSKNGMSYLITGKIKHDDLITKESVIQESLEEIFS